MTIFFFTIHLPTQPVLCILSHVVSLKVVCLRDNLSFKVSKATLVLQLVCGVSLPFIYARSPDPACQDGMEGFNGFEVLIWILGRYQIKQAGNKNKWSTSSAGCKGNR